MRRKRPLLLGIHADPPPWLQWTLTLAPLIVVLIGYNYCSDAYLAENERGKLLPSYVMMLQRFWALTAFMDIEWSWVLGDSIPIPTDITFTGNLLWGDTVISLFTRFLIGLTVSAIIGLFLGINIAFFPTLRYLVLPWVTALSFVPVVAVLPILLIMLGIGEEAKIVLIILGLVFIITRDMYAKTREMSQKLLTNARTLGATQFGLVYRIALPMLMPRLFASVRLNLGAAWYCLMMGEAIAAQHGLAYRIFLFRRVGPDMAGIIPYVIWITLLAFCVYWILLVAQRLLYPWCKE